MITFRKFLLFAVIISALALWSCQSKDSPGNSLKSGARASEKLKILTTIAPLYSFTKNIAGDIAQVDNLLPPGAEPHEYALSPVDMKKAAEANVLVINGVGLETWLDKMIRSSETHRALIVVDTSAGVKVMNKDPHIWLAPGNAVIQAQNIRDALIKADPGNSAVYSRNAAEYIDRLNNLDREIKDEVETWSKKEFVAFHSAFGYFARDYGLKQAAVIQETPEIEPSPRHIASVVEIIKSRGIKSIFTEPGGSHKIVRSLADDLGLQVYSLDTLETGSPNRDWYEERMRANLAVMREALK